MKAKQFFKIRKLGNSANTGVAVFSVIMLIVGMAVAGLLYTFTTVLGGQTYELVEDDIDAITSYSSVNYSFVAKNNTWVSLGNTSLRTGYVHLYNTTSWADKTSSFSVNYTTGYVLLIADNSTLNGTTMKAVYDYDDGLIKTAIKSGIISNFEAQQQIGEYMPIIALAIIITIIISLIITGIAGRFMGSQGLGPNKGDMIL